MGKTLAILVLVLSLLAAACGGEASSGDDRESSTDATPAPSTTLAPAPGELGPVAALLGEAFIAEGFTSDESDCLAAAFSDEYGEKGIQKMLMADEQPADFEEVMAKHAFACLSFERMVEIGDESPAPDSGSRSAVSAHLSCTDPADDIRSEFSGWSPSIPWGMGDVAATDLTIEDGYLTVTIRVQGSQLLTGGPGDTPLIARMYLVTGDEMGPVAYDIELMRSDNEDDPAGPILVTTIDGQSGDFVSSETFDDVYLGPGLMTATIPVAAVDQVVTEDFWAEIRTEWGPDHPIGSNEEWEWMIDSACDGPQLVTIGGPESDDTSAANQPWSPKTIDDLVDPVALVEQTFKRRVPKGWYEQVWMKPADGGGEVTARNGVRFTGLGDSTRAGIMTDVNADVSDFPHVVLAISGAVLDQTLAGTGWNGREAPLAVAVTYVDAAGTSHVGLSEDVMSPTNMLYLGFTALPEPDMANGVEVSIGEQFTSEFDLMSLDPAPVTILSLVVEGGGWAPRVGEVYEIALMAGF